MSNFDFIVEKKEKENNYKNTCIQYFSEQTHIVISFCSMKNNKLRTLLIGRTFLSTHNCV